MHTSDITWQESYTTLEKWKYRIPLVFIIQMDQPIKTRKQDFVEGKQLVVVIASHHNDKLKVSENQK